MNPATTITDETKRKLRDMQATDILAAIQAQDPVLTTGLSFEQRIELIVDDAYSAFVNTKVKGLIRRAALRYPQADLRRLDLLDERGIDRATIASLASGRFIDHHTNIVLQGFTGSGKSYLACAVAKLACQLRYRTYYIRMPDMEEEWLQAQDKPNGATKFLKKYASYNVLVIDEWLLDEPDSNIRTMLLELFERRYDNASTIFCTQYAKKDWHHRLGSSVHADAIMDRIVHNTIWLDTGTYNMREHTAKNDN